jgi:hypothetical protein
VKDKVKIFKKKMKNQIHLTRGDILLRHLAAIVRISLHSLEQVYRLINLFYNEKLIKKWSRPAKKELQFNCSLTIVSITRVIWPQNYSFFS